MKSSRLGWGQSEAKFRGLVGFLFMIALLAVPALWADGPAPGTRAVRLSSVDGQVQISQGNHVIAAQAVANTPLFEGTQVVTADDGRAEIQFEDGSVARLSPNSSLAIPVLRGQGSASEAEIVLQSGLGYFELQDSGQAGKISVRFADSVVTGGGFTVLRVNLDNPPGEVAVFSGNAHLERGTALAVDLHGGESLSLKASDPTAYNVAESIEPDSWDSWNSDRDQALTSEAAARTGAAKSMVDSNNPAWNDLDANGNWYNVPGQGYIWSPYDAANAGWDPYGNGNWMYSQGNGYIWASGYPWGYMPYQCGMWNYYDAFGWGWSPGMGGCQPWWGGAGYYGPNIGNGFGGYRPPNRPRPPHRPIAPGRSYPVVAVNRAPARTNAVLPARDRAVPVVIAGHTVQPLRPSAPRPQYGGNASAFVNHTSAPGYAILGSQAPGASGGGHPPGPTFGARPTSSFSAPSNSSQHNSSTSRGSSGGYVSGGAAPASHAASSGGSFSGGGGASHSGGGGGGGGGGGHH